MGGRGGDRTWEAIKPYISTSAGEIRDFDLSAVSRDLEISVADLEKIVGLGARGALPEKTDQQLCFRSLLDCACRSSSGERREAEKLKVRNAEDLRANFRRRV